MANSRRLKALATRLDQLRSTFLPTSYSPTGSYSQSVLDRARAFRVLAHAEFESFVEDIVSLYVTKAVGQWNSSKKVSLPLLCILGSYPGNELISNFPKDTSKPGPISLSTLLNKAHAHFKKTTGDNNGIRSWNILALLVQAGLDEAALDAVWLGTIDQFGAERGKVAHSSGASRYVTYTTDPQTTAMAASAIFEGFREVDEKLRVIHRNL